MNFIKPNLKSLPEQVDINTNDIKNLKSIIKSSYKTEKELETTTISIPITDTNAPQDTTRGWLYDSVGHLFSINGGDNTNLLLEYYTNFRGPAGINGVAVVQTTGTSTESVMSQNAVTTELESKANIDASNLSSENVTSWSNKLGIGTIATELESRAKSDASNLSQENVTSWNNKLGCENVENIEIIYDKDSNDANINWGYTSGIAGNSVIQRDISKYKKLIAYVATNITENTNYSPTQVILDLKSLAPQNGRYRSMQTIQNYYSGWSEVSYLPELATVLLEASLGKDDISFYTNLQVANSTTHNLNRETFVIYKIEGVY